MRGPCENPQQPHVEFFAQVQKPPSYGPKQSSLDLEELYRNLEQIIEGRPRQMFGHLEVYHHLSYRSVQRNWRASIEDICWDTEANLRASQ